MAAGTEHKSYSNRFSPPRLDRETIKRRFDYDYGFPLNFTKFENDRKYIYIYKFAFIAIFLLEIISTKFNKNKRKEEKT